MVGVDGGRGVADVHRLALAACLTLTLAGPHHAGFLAALFKDFDFVALEHGADVWEARLLETVHEAAVSVVVNYGSGPRL